MGQVKRLIEDITYNILEACDLEDTQKNYDKVFLWVMDSDLQLGTPALINKFREEQPLEEVTDE